MRVERLFKIVLTVAFMTGLLCAADDKPFVAGKAETYPHHATIQNVTVAVDVFDRPDKVKEAFGKPDPLKYGVLPVLLVIKNGLQNPIAIAGMRLEMVTDDSKIEPTPAQEIVYARSPRRPDEPKRLPFPRSDKNPLTDPVFQVRSFQARLVQPGEQVSGFVYFLTPARAGATLLLRGLKQMPSGEELFFFEIPLGN